MAISRRAFLRAGAILTLGSQAPGPWTGRAAAQGGGGPLRLGFQVHRTGIGAVYGRWYASDVKNVLTNPSPTVKLRPAAYWSSAAAPMLCSPSATLNR